MPEGSAKQMTSTSAAAVSVADAAYARSAEGLQSAEEANSYHVSQQAYARSAEGLQSIQCVIL